MGYTIIKRKQKGGMNVQKKVGVILNPVAGKKRGKALLADLLDGLCRLSCDLSVFVTADRGDATVQAMRYGKECDMVCCIGGDGTLNETISGLMQIERRIPLCYVPTGSTNDFAQACGIPTDLTQTIELVRRNRTVRVDLGRFDERYFTYIASFGLFTRASYSTDQTVKNVIGHLAYIFEGAKELQDLGKSYRVKITCDDAQTIEGDFLFGGIANTTSLGGIFHLPKQRVTLDDGKFELLLIRVPKTVDDLWKILNMMQTGIFDGELIVFLQAARLKVESPTPISWCLDGEFAGDRTCVTVQNEHRALQIYSGQRSQYINHQP